MKLPPELEAAVLATPGVVVRGAGSANAGRRAAKVPLAPAMFTPPATWLVPVYVVAGDNMGGRDRHRKIGRGGHERAAVHRTLARQYAALTPFVESVQAGQKVFIRLTRIGPRRMDFMNVVASLKWCQDAVAERFGVDDGSPLFDWRYAQKIGREYAVRIEVAGVLR